MITSGVYNPSDCQRQRSGDDPRAVLDRCAACGKVRIATTCGSYPATPCSPHSLSSCFLEIIQIIGALAKDIAVVATKAPTNANPTISSSESNFLFVAVAHRMRDKAKMIRNHFLRIATNRRNRGDFLSIFIFSANVRAVLLATRCGSPVSTSPLLAVH